MFTLLNLIHIQHGINYSLKSCLDQRFHLFYQLKRNTSFARIFRNAQLLIGKDDVTEAPHLEHCPP